MNLYYCADAGLFARTDRQSVQAFSYQRWAPMIKAFLARTT